MEKTAIVEKYSSILEDKSFRAAYALNMCTVSISQIIDYADSVILEQEYEAILNNLNLELMPKDEALLRIYTQLLDTITFFRISEGDKKIIEKEYAQKMKNAIWASVPNFGMIFTGGVSPLSVVFSLASQVGIGYMNYRKNKAEYEMERDKEYWKLQRTAMEQFNSLRRELFATAWRLAEKYNYPDEYRLSENQIKQYNNILMDQDELRRFERLEYIQDSFYAYPPYWYFIGHAANEVSRNENLSVETRDFYRCKAKEYFEIFISFSEINILREDKLTASCALEYIDLLDNNVERHKIIDLLNLASKSFSGAEDVLQICAFDYLKINAVDESIRLLRHLVNENYNTVLNAQFLSMLYVQKYIEMNSDIAKRGYETLAGRVNQRFLFPFPRNNETIDLNDKFINEQKDILSENLDKLCKCLYQKYVVKMNKLLPCPENLGDDYFTNVPQIMNVRRMKMKNFLNISSNSGDFRNKLCNMELQCDLIEVLNSLLNSIKRLNVFFDVVDINKIISSANNLLISNSMLVNETQTQAQDGKMTFTNFEQSEIMFENLIREILKYVLVHGRKQISEIESMSEIARVEDCYVKVCDDEKIPTSEIAVDNLNIEESLTTETFNSVFTISVFGKDAMVLNDIINTRVSIAKIVKEYQERIVGDNDCNSKHKALVYINGSNGFDEYVRCDKGQEIYINIKSKIAAFIVNSYSHSDLILTAAGLFVKMYNKSEKSIVLSKLIPYETIELMNNNTVLLNGAEYRNEALNMPEFIKMVKSINELRFK